MSFDVAALRGAAEIKITIEFDREKVQQSVRSLENDALFDRLKRAKVRTLPEEVQRVLHAIGERGSGVREELEKEFAPCLARSGFTLQVLINDGFLVEDTVGLSVVVSRPEVKEYPEPLSREEMERIERELGGAMTGPVLKSFVREVNRNFGPAGLRVIESVMAELGAKYASRVEDVKGKGPKAVGLKFVALMQGLNNPVRIVEVTDDRVRFRIDGCAYGLGRGDADICHAVSEFDRSLVGHLGCKVYYPRVVPDGYPYCEGVVY
ncbi:MAG: hypothetical protein K6T75_08940 [Acetobacteraceae bacterium]|nr:hypothetical protein [Acetobacteraceae bacterium]